MRTLTVLAKALLYLVIYAGVVLLTNQLLYTSGAFPSLKAWLDDNPAGLLLIANPIVLALYVPLMRGQRIRLLDIGFTAPRSLLVSAGAGLWLGLFIATFVRIPWVKEGFPAITDLVGFVADGGNFLVFALGSLLLGSLLEEWLFRGILLHLFRQRFGAPVSVLLQAIFFGAVFMNVTVGLFAALGAIVYGIIRTASGSLWSSLTTHLFSTGMLYAVSLLLKDGVQTDTLVVLAAVSGLALIGFLYVMLRGITVHSPKPGLQSEWKSS